MKNVFLILGVGVFLFTVYLLFMRNDTNVTNDDKGSVNSEVKDIPNQSSGNKLDLSGQDLKSTPVDVFSDTSIQELNLSNNQLEGSLPAEIRHLQKLKVLNLSDNQFTGVPAEIGQLVSLEVLDLSNNKLTGLPYELGDLSNLKVLNLKGNNYASADLEIIKQKLPATTKIQVD